MYPYISIEMMVEWMVGWMVVVDDGEGSFAFHTEKDEMSTMERCYYLQACYSSLFIGYRRLLLAINLAC